MNRRVQILVALVLTALWGAGVYAAHANGHLRFLDRLEATITDLRTLVRGVQPALAAGCATADLTNRTEHARTKNPAHTTFVMPASIPSARHISRRC